MAQYCNPSAPVAVLLLMLCFLLVAENLTQRADAIWLTIPSSGTKCLSEEIQNNIVVLANYYAFNEQNPEQTFAISTKVTSPYGNTLHQNKNVTMGQFAFTTSEDGIYMACFWVDSLQQQFGHVTLGLDWKIGISAKDWDSVVTKEKIQGVELALKRIAEVVQYLHYRVNYLKEREAGMRQVSERTNERVAWFSMMSIGVCIAVSVLQLWHLQRFFQKKKLI
ncbi:hypothetical protein K2173_023119 [Erythroxylum novogranatense]|uniref:GOLD domain-containing protein n=1 Tax=Erythroxylum novogranatense TaxID=1862640 RepID=A0AAV8T9V4_9ROSI|nr:hypothetical protein K2173_023119 [Erythroxylum novogranatense]